MPKKTRGFTLIEIMAATVVTLTLIAISAQMLASTAVQRRGAERRAVALEEAANTIEALRTLDFGSITPERAAEFQLSEVARQVLGQGNMKIDIEPVISGPPAKLVRVEISWPNPSGGPIAPVRLATWVFSHEKAATP